MGGSNFFVTPSNDNPFVPCTFCGSKNARPPLLPRNTMNFLFLLLAVWLWLDCFFGFTMNKMYRINNISVEELQSELPNHQQ